MRKIKKERADRLVFSRSSLKIFVPVDTLTLSLQKITFAMKFRVINHFFSRSIACPRAVFEFVKEPSENSYVVCPLVYRDGVTQKHYIT